MLQVTRQYCSAAVKATQSIHILRIIFWLTFLCPTKDNQCNLHDCQSFSVQQILRAASERVCIYTQPNLKGQTTSKLLFREAQRNAAASCDNRFFLFPSAIFLQNYPIYPQNKESLLFTRCRVTVFNSVPFLNDLSHCPIATEIL